MTNAINIFCGKVTTFKVLYFIFLNKVYSYFKQQQQRAQCVHSWQWTILSKGKHYSEWWEQPMDSPRETKTNESPVTYVLFSILSPQGEIKQGINHFRNMDWRIVFQY